MRRLKRLSAALFIISLILLVFHVFKVRILDDRTGPVFHMDNRTVEVSVKGEQEAERPQQAKPVLNFQVPRQPRQTVQGQDITIPDFLKRR